MDESAVNEILDEIVSSLEPLEAQNTAILHFLKAKGIATDEDLGPFMEEATNASNVRWRAFRLRTAALISSAMKAPEKESQGQVQDPKKEPEKAQANDDASGKQQKDQQPAEPTPEAPAAVNEEKSGQKKNDAPTKQQNEAA
jgi:hypothetical protein